MEFMFTWNYWNERAKRSGSSLRTVMKRSLPDFVNRYFDKQQKKFILSTVGEGNSLLEVGCGYGRLLKVIESSNCCVGLDFSRNMLLQAKNNLKSPIVLAHARNLPFKDNSFDNIMCVTVLIHILNIDEIIDVLKEMNRVLKNDGVLIIGEMGYVSNLVQFFFLKLGIAKHAISLDPEWLKSTVQSMDYSIIIKRNVGIFPIDLYFIVGKKNNTNII